MVFSIYFVFSHEDQLFFKRKTNLEIISFQIAVKISFLCSDKVIKIKNEYFYVNKFFLIYM